MTSAARKDSPRASDRVPETLRGWIAGSHDLLIGGRWVAAASGRRFATHDPGTGIEITQVAEGGAEDIDRAVKAARAAFEAKKGWSSLTPAARAKIIWRIGDLIESHADELAMIETLDNGKPFAMARAVDVAGAAEAFRYFAGWCTKIEGRTVPVSLSGAFHAYTRREPVGVTGQIVPWNFPLMMASWKVAPALAAGCTVILKPAEQTPLTALRLGELCLEAGLPPGVVNIVTGFGETAGAALAGHEGVDKIAFTGSTSVGKLIVKAATGNLKKVSLELGGKSPALIFADADLEQAIPTAAGAIFFNAGQVCTAWSRLYVHQSLYEQVVAGIAKIAESRKLGHGFDPDTEMGPLVSQEQQSRVSSYVEGAREARAEVVAGGRKPLEQGYFYAPTVITKTHDKMPIMSEEVFGPVLTISPFSDTDQALREANHSIYGLGASVFTRDLSLAHRVAAQLQAGQVWVNCDNYADMAMPFGGYKQSGWGREGGSDAVDLYTQTKSVFAQL